MHTRTHLAAVLAATSMALGLAACGSSKVAGVIEAPSGGKTAESNTATPVTPPTSTAATPPAPVPPALAKKPVIVAPKGPPPAQLVTKDLIKGTGAPVGAGQTVTVNYVGVVYKTGKQFDASFDRNQPFTTALSAGSVIPGWVQGIVGMRVGGRRELIIPPALAYGKAGRPPVIPPSSTLIFDVDLLSAK